MKYVDNITFDLPKFVMVCGASDQGKTFWLYEGFLKPLLQENYLVHWIVNDRFPIESKVAEEMRAHKKSVFVHPAHDLSDSVIAKLIQVLRSNDKKKVVLVDNFTHEISPALLELSTYIRKYNATLVLITHSFFAKKDISARLRDLAGYYVLFWMKQNDTNANLQHVIGRDLYEIYRDQIGDRSFKFLIVSDNEFTIGKLPEYTIKTKFRDQVEKGDLGKVLRTLNEEMLNERYGLTDNKKTDLSNPPVTKGRRQQVKLAFGPGNKISLDVKPRLGEKADRLEASANRSGRQTVEPINNINANKKLPTFNNLSRGNKRYLA